MLELADSDKVFHSFQTVYSMPWLTLPMEHLTQVWELSPSPPGW